MPPSRVRIPPSPFHARHRTVSPQFLTSRANGRAPSRRRGPAQRRYTWADARDQIVVLGAVHTSGDRSLDQLRQRIRQGLPDRLAALLLEAEPQNAGEALAVRGDALSGYFTSRSRGRSRAEQIGT